MTHLTDPHFDARIADWLEADPDTAPGEVLHVVESAFPSIPQRRSLRLPWRFPTMTTPVRLVALVVLGVVLIASVSLLGGAGGPSTPTTPTTQPSEAAAAPSAAASPSPDPHASFKATLIKTFASTLYPYTIKTDPTWTSQSATVPIYSPDSTDANSSDNIRVTGTDTTIGGVAQPLDQPTIDAFLQAYRQSIIGTVPANCDPGDPSIWPSIQVGDLTGKRMRLCNFEQAIVERDGVVYTFTWSNDTFDESSHLDPSRYWDVLKTVTFTGAPLPSVAPAASPS